jgi:hypothetical protein
MLTVISIRKTGKEKSSLVTHGTNSRAHKPPTHKLTATTDDKIYDSARNIYEKEDERNQMAAAVDGNNPMVLLPLHAFSSLVYKSARLPESS